MHFGPTEKEELPDEGMVIAKKVARKTATMTGISAELQVQKQQIKHLTEKVESLEGLYKTVINMYETLQRQRAAELNMRVNRGPTKVD